MGSSPVTSTKKAAEHVALRSFCDKAGQEPPLGLNTSALTRKEGDPEKRRSIFSGRGGASGLTMRGIQKNSQKDLLAKIFEKEE